MNKASLLAVSLASAVLVGGISIAPVAHAQVYTSYGTPTYTTGYNACVDLTAPMTIGSSDALTGGQVSSLQNFLVSDGLLSSSLVTGYFGSVTSGAVAQFQSTHGIQPSGVVGPLTRAAIQQASCGNTSIVSPAQPIYPTNPIYSINPGGPIQYGYYAPELTSLSVSYQTGSPIITLNGYGFDASDNTVLFGNVDLSNVASNGTTMTFAEPNLAPGMYDVYVTTSHGTSKALSYTLTNNTQYNSCGSNNINPYNGGSQCNNCVYNNYEPYSTTNYSYNNGNNCVNNSQATLNSLSTNSGTPGTTVTAFGSGFSTNGNTVHFGGTIINNISSNGNTLTFTVPYIGSNVGSGNYSVYITNNNGSSSNSISFSITNSNNNCSVYNYSYNNSYQCGNQYGNQYGSLSISYLSPAQANPGTQIAIQGSGFTGTDTIYFGNGSSQSVQSSNNSSTLYYTIPYVSAGSYPIYVTNQNGQSSNTVSLQVF